MTSSQILAIIISTALVGIWREFRPHYAAFKYRRKAAEVNGTATHLLKSGHIRATEITLLVAACGPVLLFTVAWIGAALYDRWQA